MRVILTYYNGYTRIANIRNEDISGELHMGSVKCKIETYKQNWINHLDKMPDERISTQTHKKFRPRKTTEEAELKESEKALAKT